MFKIYLNFKSLILRQISFVATKKSPLQASEKKYSKQVHREMRRAVVAMMGPKWHTTHLTDRS